MATTQGIITIAGVNIPVKTVDWLPPGMWMLQSDDQIAINGLVLPNRSLWREIMQDLYGYVFEELEGQ